MGSIFDVKNIVEYNIKSSFSERKIYISNNNLYLLIENNLNREIINKIFDYYYDKYNIINFYIMINKEHDVYFK